MTDSQMQSMLGFLERRVGKTGRPLTVDTPLVSSGLVDSFMLIEVLTELERVSGKRIPASHVSPEDMETVRSMAGVVARV